MLATSPNCIRPVTPESIDHIKQIPRFVCGVAGADWAPIARACITNILLHGCIKRTRTFVCGIVHANRAAYSTLQAVTALLISSSGIPPFPQLRSPPLPLMLPFKENNVFFLKQLGDARNIRNRLLECFERAASPYISDKERTRLLSFLVVGGGPTSIEYAAELHDFLTTDVKRWYPDLQNKVILLMRRSLALTTHTYGIPGTGSI